MLTQHAYHRRKNSYPLAACKLLINFLTFHISTCLSCPETSAMAVILIAPKIYFNYSNERNKKTAWRGAKKMWSVAAAAITTICTSLRWGPQFPISPWGTTRQRMAPPTAGWPVPMDFTMCSRTRNCSKRVHYTMCNYIQSHWLIHICCQSNILVIMFLLGNILLMPIVFHVSAGRALY